MTEHTLAVHEEAADLLLDVESYTNMLAALELVFGAGEATIERVPSARSALGRRIGLEPARFDYSSGLTELHPSEATDRHSYRSG